MHPLSTPGAGRARRVGILGGTFDPIHIGHLAAAVNVRAALALDTVLFVVANLPWQKVGERSITEASDRFDLVTSAIGDVEGLEACALEIERGGPSYTIDTIDELRAASPDDELFLIVGSDVAASIDTWKQPDRIREAVTLVVMNRAGTAPVRPDATTLPAWRAVFVEIPALAISSTDLRTRSASGQPLDFLVPDAAIRVIRERGLYPGTR
jgi:nicotinate-nucleotide adenylyltransferase